MTALLPKIFLPEDRHVISPMDPSLAIEQFTALIWKLVLSSRVVRYCFELGNLMRYTMQNILHPYIRRLLLENSACPYSYMA